MKTEVAVLLNEVMKRLRMANADRENIHMIFLNRYSDIDYVSTTDDGSDIDTDELAMRAGNPYWEICTVRPNQNEIIINNDFFAFEDVTEELLANAVAEAVATRIWFYEEREKLYGASAWPKTVVTPHGLVSPLTFAIRRAMAEQ